MKVPDEIRWDRPSGEPVVRPGQLHSDLDAGHAGAAQVLDLGDRYRMYYWGRGTKGNVILSAESATDHPNAWQARGTALLSAQPGTDYNCDGPSFPFVIPLDDKLWHMYFGAWGKPREDGRLPNSTGLAVSEDAGLTWRYHSDEPVLAMDRQWDCSGTGSVSVIKEGGELRMYYTAIGEYYKRPQGVETGHGDMIPRIGIGYAVSTDGIHWEKSDGLMVAPRGFDADPYEYINSKPFVLPDGGCYRMWISAFGSAYRIRSLVSEDGLHWNRVQSGPEGDLGVGETGAFDDHQRSYAVVVKRDGTYQLWYTGNGFGATGTGYAQGRTEEDPE